MDSLDIKLKLVPYQNSNKAQYTLEHLKLLVSLSKPAQKVFICLLELLENNEIAMSQAALGRKFGMTRNYVSKGIAGLVAKQVLIRQDDSFYLNI